MPSGSDIHLHVNLFRFMIIVMHTNLIEISNLDHQISALLRERIYSKPGRSITDLAECLGVRRATLSAHLNGHQPVSFGLAVAVGGYVGLSAVELLENSRVEAALASVILVSESA